MMQAPPQQAIEVSVGIIRDPWRRIFITQRREGVELAGYWEFPGGKVEAGETPKRALIRELYEEVGISVEEACLLQRVTGTHPRYSLLLHCFLVERWQGTPYGREGQAGRWVAQRALKLAEFPSVNASCIEALVAHDSAQ